MGEAIKIWEKWEKKEYSNLKTYSLMQQSEYIQEIVRKAFLESMMKRIRRITGDRVFKHTVDLGCATGEWSCKYADFSERVTGLDLNESFIEQARKNRSICMEPEKITFLQSNLLEYDNYDNADFVCSGAVLMYVNDTQIEELIQKINSRTEEDAWIYIRVSVRAFLHPRKDNDIGFYRTRRFYKKLFKSSGFKIVDVCSTSHVVIHEMLRDVTKFNKIPFMENIFFKFIGFFIILKQMIFGGNDYLNFILKKK